MIGTTNVAGSANSKGKVEKINLTLKTNQSSHEDLVGMSFNLKYENVIVDHTWDGNAMTIEVPAGVEYTILFNEVQGYSTPASVTYAAISGNARTVNAVYKTEIITVTVDANNGESTVGQVVTINGTQYTWDGTAITQKIPFGTIYEVSVNDKEEYVTPQAQSFTANKANRNVTMQYTEIPFTDLSKVDIYGNPIAQNTANCYVIKEAGKYKFPIAYGAAIKNGEANPTAYTNNGGANSHDFVNYLGNVITSPYVETDTATQAASVQISIADTNSVLSELQIIEKADCRYVQFKVDSVPATGANLVLSVKDISGVIMWSWHIWLWEDDMTPVEITNATNVKYQILPYNLGSKWDEDAKTHIKNWLYQFGRPTPLLCPSAYNSTSDHASYGVLSYAAASIASDIQTGIKNPATFYKYSSSYSHNWFQANSGKNYNLWDAACTSTGNSDNNVVKTIYDPCPIGFKMPNGNTFTYFSTSNVVGSFANGYKFKRYSGDTVGVFFPASGRREPSDGSLSVVGSFGCVWLSSAFSHTYAFHLYFYSGDVYPQNYSIRPDGYSIRPVKDEDLALPTHKLTINVSGSGYEVKVYSVTKSTDETTGEVTETLGDVLATQTTASATHELTWGTEYKIVAGDVESYITPASQSYVADIEYRSVSLEYIYHSGTLNPTNGVYIQDTDGYFHTEAEWDGSYTADCVAVITNACRFGIALTEYDGTMRIHGDFSGALENYMTAISDETQAKADYNGAANTANIMKLQSGTGYAAGWCNAFSFPSGKKGFLPSFGQMWVAYSNKAAVDAAITKAGGTALISSYSIYSEYYWTSTFGGVNTLGDRVCKVLRWIDGDTNGNAIGSTNHVRAFSAL